jgi:hypothetical protein
MLVGIEAHEANKKRIADEAAAAQVKAQAQATCQKNMAKIGVLPEDPIMQAPEGPGPSSQELRAIQQEFSGKPRKWKLGEAESTVSSPNFRSQGD